MFNGNLYQTLVLNSDFRPLDYFPLSTWDWKEAVCAALTDRVSVVYEHDAVAHAANFEVNIPSVVALREYIPRKHRPSFTRSNLIVLRDRCCCVYCGQTFAQHHLTYDHVIPRSKGGLHKWTNVAAACLACNQKKADRTPEQAKMPLLWRPWEPTTQDLFRAEWYFSQRKAHKTWEEFLDLPL